MLTEKRRRFIEEYLIDPNAAGAVVRAGFRAKNPRVAARIGVELLQIPEIRAIIDERLEQIHSEKVANVQEVMEYLSAVLRGEHVEEVVVVEGTGQGFSVACTKEKALAPKDRLKAAELLAKRYGLLGNKLDIDIKAPVVFSGEDDIE